VIAVLVRLAIHADRYATFAHAAQLWQAERRMHLGIGPWLNGLARAWWRGSQCPRS
jgi:hypothetical protein